MREFITESVLFINIYFTDTLVKLNETILDDHILTVSNQQNAENVFNIYSIQVILQQGLSVATKHVITTCEYSSQNLCCLKTSTSHTC